MSSEGVQVELLIDQLYDQPFEVRKSAIHELMKLGTTEAMVGVVYGLEALLDGSRVVSSSQRTILFGEYMRTIRSFPKLVDSKQESEPINALEGVIYGQVAKMTPEELGALSAAYGDLVRVDRERWDAFLMNLQTNPDVDSDERKIAVVRGATRLTQE